MGFLDFLVDDYFMPHGHCYFWQPDILWSNVIGDGATALAYYSIPLLLITFLHRRQDIQYRSIFMAFALFILACGTVHILAVVSVWEPVYRIEGYVKLATASISLTTVFLLARRFPEIVRIPTLQQLQRTNERLSREIEEHHRTTAALQQREESLDFIMRQAPVGMGLLDLDGRWTKVNDALLEMLGYSEQEMLGHSFEEITYPADLPADQEIVRQLTEEEDDEARFEKRYVRKDGTPVWCWLNVRFIRNTTKGDSYFIAQVVDISDRKRLEEELIQKRDILEAAVQERTRQLQESNRDMEHFIYAVTHDLRLPLKNLEGLVGALREEVAPAVAPTEADQIMALIEENAGRMDSLITDLLAFSRAGRNEIRKEPIDMRGLAREAFTDCVKAYPDKAVEFELQDDLPSSYGDRKAIRQVWENLISNALKYSSKKETIRVQISARQENGQIIYGVQDNGVGFNEAYKHKLFNLFQRLHQEHDFPGTGLGLAVVQRIVQKHGGEIWAESRQDEGATFYFTLTDQDEEGVRREE